MLSWIRVGSEIYSSNIGQDVFIGFKCRILNTTIESNVQIASGCVFGENGKDNSSSNILELKMIYRRTKYEFFNLKFWNYGNSER